MRMLIIMFMVSSRHLGSVGVPVAESPQSLRSLGTYLPLVRLDDLCAKWYNWTMSETGDTDAIIGKIISNN